MSNTEPIDTVRILERVAKLEERVDGGLGYVQKELREIKENHLQHLQADVTDLKLKVNSIAVKVSIGVSVATILIELVFRFFFR